MGEEAKKAAVNVGTPTLLGRLMGDSMRDFAGDRKGDNK
jgi:hypothetical protein